MGEATGGQEVPQQHCRKQCRLQNYSKGGDLWKLAHDRKCGESQRHANVHLRENGIDNGIMGQYIMEEGMGVADKGLGKIQAQTRKWY